VRQNMYRYPFVAASSGRQCHMRMLNDWSGTAFGVPRAKQKVVPQWQWGE